MFYLLIVEMKSHTGYISKNPRRKTVYSKSIGKTLAGDSYPSTIDGYWFVVKPGIILNTFDFVTVNNFKSKTIGLVQDIRALPSTSSTKNGIITASVAVTGNTGIKMKSGKLKTINLPVPTGVGVRFSTKNEVLFALGVPEMESPIPAGIIEYTLPYTTLFRSRKSVV